MNEISGLFARLLAGRFNRLSMNKSREDVSMTWSTVAWINSDKQT